MTDFSSHRSDWWRQAVVYQVYPRSFADADGDGLGDLRGVTDRLPHLRRPRRGRPLAHPLLPSELADGGYDVADHRDVDPGWAPGDFDALVAEAHRLGLKVIVDVVPNHTSHQHVWFQEALAAGPGSPARERYVFRDGRGPDGELPPTDWQSVFGGSAWQRVPDGQWYLHLFAREQPDLNWDHAEVREDFGTTLRFWSDRGVDGFRVDVAHALAKDLAEPLRDLGAPELFGEEALHRLPRAPTPSTTATRSTRSTATGAACSTPTPRRARPWPRPGCPVRGVPSTPARTNSTRLSTSSTCKPAGTRRRSARSSPTRSPGPGGRRLGHLGALQPRRRTARLAPHAAAGHRRRRLAPRAAATPPSTRRPVCAGPARRRC